MRLSTWRAAPVLLLFLTACSACAPGTRPVPVPPPPTPACPSPEQPELRPLDLNEHLGSARNLEILMDNVNARTGYIERLEAALRCWREREAR